MKRLLYRVSRWLRKAEYWLIARATMSMLWLLRKLPPDKAMDFAASVARRLGPLSARHKIALDNLSHAYPELDENARRKIALDMWENMARLGAEYIFLEQIFDFDPHAAKSGRVEVVGAERFLRIRDEKRPHILFTGHLGNFELLPVAAAAFDLDLAVMFRPPNNPYIADYVFSTRRSAMGRMLASAPGVAFALSRVLEAGGNIGVLVDQKFNGGVPTTFFDRPCETSPLVARLARHFDCDIYPAHCIRLPGNRFRLELHEKLDLPRGSSGAIDVQRTTQLLNDVVEGWVRETPGQWMWFHKRWEMNGRRRKRRKAWATARKSS
ncbi:MAG: lipid A biosynthesis lauroyl acyltransferase [Rhizobiales bacterium 65-79]|jgi:KDO2-lipid IV(A) lauroyltransferase|nr:lipid A biosynthesis lauroyl acyltransferase [Hyphomicrobiales bacterium]OJU05123.1 MAG: lipid A biosynthesis lauroyl acyltransferase [Rhizobiales bacterium 65-79]